MADKKEQLSPQDKELLNFFAAQAMNSKALVPVFDYIDAEQCYVIAKLMLEESKKH